MITLVRTRRHGGWRGENGIEFSVALIAGGAGGGRGREANL